MTQAASSPNYAQLVLDLTGHWGRWQLKYFVFYLLFSVLFGWNALQVSFQAPNVDYWCVNKKGQQSSEKNIGVNGSEPNQCMASDGLACSAWQYDVGQSGSFYHSTIVSEWDLVCDRGWLASFSQSAYMGGALLAGSFMSHLSDRIGRKPTMLIGWAISLVATLSAAFSVNIVQFLLSRLVIGFGMFATYSTGFVLMLEIVGPKYRETIGLAAEFGWAAGYSSLPALVWLVRDFRYLLLICAGAQLLFVVMYRAIYESPRWLLANGRLEEAICELGNAVTMNQTNGKDDVDFEGKIAELKSIHEMTQSVDEREIEGETYSFLDLFRSWSMAKITLIVYFLWFSNCLVYYGLSLNTNALAGDPLVNFFLMGIIEIPAYVVSIYLVKWFGNRKVLLWTLIGAALGCWASILIESHYLIGITFAMAGKACVTISYAILYVYTAEIFPTVIRTIGLGTGSVMGRVGSMIAPYIKDLTQLTGVTFSMTILGIVALISGLMILPLQEPKGTNMPDKPEDVELQNKSND